MVAAHQFLETLAIVLCAAAATTVLFTRLKQPVVLGYLLAGMAVGPNVPIPLHADTHVVETLSELGIILLMFSLGLEFSLRKLLKAGATATFVAIVQCSLMLWMGYLAGQWLGWTRLASFYAGAAIAISSTTIIIKAFEEQRLKDDFKQIVFGILIVEDLIAILLITVLTGLSTGKPLGTLELAIVAGRLAAFLVVTLLVGLWTVPRMIRAIVRLDRPETTVVSSVGLAFGLSYLAASLGYSVALGAFLAGSLIGESGVESTVERLIQPVRDLFAAIFFVSVGMLIDPNAIAAHGWIVLVFVLIVVLGKIGSVTWAALMAGQSVESSVKIGLSMGQIGEFSFIIAGLGLTTGATDKLLYSIAVAVSGITTLLTPLLIRAAPATASFVDRKLPRPLQTFAALYGSWLEQLKNKPATDSDAHRLRRSVRWLALDAIIVLAVVIGAAVEWERVQAFLKQSTGASDQVTKLMILFGVALLSAPFWIGVIRTAKQIGNDAAARIFPMTPSGKVDLADAPRRLVVVAIQLAVVVLIGLPIVAITQPFLSSFQGAAVLLIVFLILAFSLWRNATNFQGHTRATGQAIVQALARQTNHGAIPETSAASEVEQIIEGLGSPVTFAVPSDCSAIGKSLGTLNLRGLTGATVLAIQRGDKVISVPAGNEKLFSGDVLIIAGTRHAVEYARELLLMQ